MTRLFHTILPVPEHCDLQMRLCGNTDPHTVRYRCVKCLKGLEVRVTFAEDPNTEAQPGVLAETDATP